MINELQDFLNKIYDISKILMEKLLIIYLN